MRIGRERRRRGRRGGSRRRMGESAGLKERKRDLRVAVTVDVVIIVDDVAVRACVAFCSCQDSVVVAILVISNAAVVATATVVITVIVVVVHHLDIALKHRRNPNSVAAFAYAVREAIVALVYPPIYYIIVQSAS